MPGRVDSVQAQIHSSCCGPEVVFAKASDAPGSGPAAGLQFFGEVAIAGDTEVMTVRLRDLAGAVLYEVSLDPS